MSPELPLLALTMGDPAGTGPELIAKAHADPALRAAARLLVVGDAGIMAEACEIVQAPARLRRVKDPAEVSSDPAELCLLDLANVDRARFRRGQVDPACGQAAYEYIRAAVDLALTGRAAAVVTSAINKESLNKAGHHFDGHTGLLAHLCGAPKVTMMLVADGLRICHVSTHVALREAIERVRPERILEVLELAHQGIRRLGIDRPHLAVAGLNPHAGEDGLFGDEEAKFIAPAIAEATRRGLHVTGPYAGDTVFFRAWKGQFDGVLAMYHDQGHIAAKMLGIWLGVNVTLGLPIIRTSVEHGTDFANAGSGRGDPRSLLAALALAARMVSA